MNRYRPISCLRTIQMPLVASQKKPMARRTIHPDGETTNQQPKTGILGLDVWDPASFPLGDSMCLVCPVRRIGIPPMYTTSGPNEMIFDSRSPAISHTNGGRLLETMVRHHSRVRTSWNVEWKINAIIDLNHNLLTPLTNIVSEYCGESIQMDHDGFWITPNQDFLSFPEGSPPPLSVGPLSGFEWLENYRNDRIRELGEYDMKRWRLMNQWIVIDDGDHMNQVKYQVNRLLSHSRHYQWSVIHLSTEWSHFQSLSSNQRDSYRVIVIDPNIFVAFHENVWKMYSTEFEQMWSCRDDFRHDMMILRNENFLLVIDRSSHHESRSKLFVWKP
jgi:hypothetical protein